MMLAAIRPELFGPIIVAGSPLSYWAGVRGKNPDALQRRAARRQLADRLRKRSRPRKIRWRMAGAEFREPEPCQHPWTNDTTYIPRSTPRRPAISASSAGGVGTSTSTRRKSSSSSTSCSSATTSPPGVFKPRRHHRRPAQYSLAIVAFCSKGDNVTPPQQALGWILDLYESVDAIRSYGQTIVYTIHESVGHLGIFVSGGVAKKEHGEFFEQYRPDRYAAARSLRGGV